MIYPITHDAFQNGSISYDELIERAHMAITLLGVPKLQSCGFFEDVLTEQDAVDLLLSIDNMVLVDYVVVWEEMIVQIISESEEYLSNGLEPGDDG